VICALSAHQREHLPSTIFEKLPRSKARKSVSHSTLCWRKEDSNSQSHLNKKLSESARWVPPALGDPPASLTPSGGRSVVKSGFP
jgi:hypothetical protein